MKYYLIGCQVFKREAEDAIRRSPHAIETNFLPYQLHQKGGVVMQGEIQKVINAVPHGFDAILLAYGLCNNGLVGIEAHQTPLVAFRTHDCIACLLGSNEAYQKEFTQTPGTYWLSIGWVENANDYSQYMGAVPEIPPPDDPAWLELVEKYGEDNAQFLWEERRKQLVNYERMAYIDTDVGPQEVMADEAKRRAVASHLRFERLTGDRRWIDALFADNWDPAKFVIVPPHHRIIARVNETIMDCVAIPQS